MEKLSLRSRGLLKRPLSFSCTCSRWGASPRLSSPHRQLLSSTSRLSASLPPHSYQDRFKLPDTPCRTRFAPSPTGYLHLGSLRTALYNYLLARATGGQFVLRIEDTDQTRLVADAETRLYQDLEWLGLSPDEGPNTQGPYGPYKQSERLPLYHDHSDRLVREGKAYRCFCSPETLEGQKALAAESGEPTNYPGTCRDTPLAESDSRANKGEKFAVRFRSAETPIVIKDIVYNRFQKKHAEEDFILMKRDGFPTYHFANVVDDHHMKITHVIRGSEWLLSTPKHVELYAALGWEPPQFAHLGLLVDSNRQKLSKRDNSANMEFYKRGHILPPALLNFAALLGWRPPTTAKQSDVMSPRKMIENFSLKFSKGDIMVSLLKLPFLQDKHLERLAQSPDPADAPILDRELITPLKTAIQAVEDSKAAGTVLAPANTPTADLGNRLTTLHILEAPFRSDLARVVVGVELPLEAPADRFPAAVQKLRYFLWEVPEHVLRQTLWDRGLAPVAPPERAVQLGQAMAYLGRKLAAVEEGAWDDGALKRTIGEAWVDEAYCALFSTPKSVVNVYKPLRWALLAMDGGMDLSRTMVILGRDETLRRLDLARSVAEDVAAADLPPIVN